MERQSVPSLVCSRCGDKVPTLHVTRDRHGNREWVCVKCLEDGESSMFAIPRVGPNATNIARRSDALYHDTSGTVTRRWLCDRIARLEAELNGGKL